MRDLLDMVKAYQVERSESDPDGEFYEENYGKIEEKAIPSDPWRSDVGWDH